MIKRGKETMKPIINVLQHVLAGYLLEIRLKILKIWIVGVIIMFIRITLQTDIQNEKNIEDH